MGTNFHFNVFESVYEFSQAKKLFVLNLFEEFFFNYPTIINWLLWITSSESLYIKNSELKENS